MLIISYLGRVLSTGYKIIKFIKFLKGSRAPRDCISNIKSTNEIREPRSCKIEKVEGMKEDFIFQNQINREYLIRYYVR